MGLDEGQNYTLEPNAEPLPVLLERDQYLELGGAETNGLLVAITWKDNAVWFSYAHSLCGATGALFWIKTTLYQYMTKKYGPMEPPSDLKMVGTSIGADEMAYPNADDLPTDEPIVRYTGGNSNVGISRMIAFSVTSRASTYPKHRAIYVGALLVRAVAQASHDCEAVGCFASIICLERRGSPLWPAEQRR